MTIKYVPKVPISSFHSKVHSFFFPGAPVIYNRYHRYFWFDPTKKKVITQNLLPCSDFLGKSFCGGFDRYIYFTRHRLALHHYKVLITPPTTTPPPTTTTTKKNASLPLPIPPHPPPNHNPPPHPPHRLLDPSKSPLHAPPRNLSLRTLQSRVHLHKFRIRKTPLPLPPRILTQWNLSSTRK